ncbi:terminase small subunit [Xanthobacteraceae bacterium Astr-EGSB]|uniref:terminase small subunit n=1 Tax=Astrobacterium formosum TaxID=3069710 RepID=UPI0027B3D1D5|nr:terminase small subunit [Xanthobacteraceae bacterium Astr-EGSB]
MAALGNPNHEAFAQAFVRGENAGSAAACYRQVFGKDNRGAASRLHRRRDIVQRVAELQQQVSQIEVKATERALERHAVTKEAVIGELAKIGFANMMDYVVINAAGDPVVDLSALDRDRAAAVAEVVVDTIPGRDDAPDVKRVRFKLHDKRAALVDLGKHLGLFVERRHVTHEFADKSEADLTGRAAEIITQLARLGVDLRAVAGADDDIGRAEAQGRPN